MFLTLRNEKTLKKMRSKTLKNNIFFFFGRNLIIRSFEIPHSIWKLHKDFKSVFVFKFRQKTKKFTPKWQKPQFEKRVRYTLVALQMWPDFMSHISACCQLLQMTNFENCIFNQHILITGHLFHHLHISSFSVVIIKTIFALSHKEQLHLQQVLKVVSGPETTS